MDVFFSCTHQNLRAIISSYLLGVVGHIGQHGGHVEHDLIALVGGVQGVGARRISWRKENFKTDVSVGLLTTDDTMMLN